MSLLELHADDLVQAGRDTAVRPVPPPAAPSKFSAWRAATAPVRGVREAAAQVLGTGAEIMGMFGEVLGAYPEALGGVGGLTDQQRQQADQQRRKLLTQGMDSTNDVAESLRRSGAMFRPDPVESHWSEQVLYQFARGAGKVVGGAMAAGPAGVVAAGAEEAVTQTEELRQQGVPLGPRLGAGAVQGAGLALAALPLVGQTIPQTAALYLAGGPGGFMAQQALTREILQNAGQEKVAMQFDPFDPVGLSVATLLPAAFTAYGLRGQRLQRAADSLPPDLATAEGRAPAAAAPDVPPPAAPIPSDLSPVARAARSYPTEAVDAAMVVHLAEQRARSNPVGDAAPMRAADQHAAALARAEEQIAAGEAVRVTDVAPDPVITPAQRDANFAAWFGDSKVVDAAGRPLVVYHGTGADITQFNVSERGEFGGGIYMTPAPSAASDYAVYRGQGPANVLPVYVSIKNPASAPEAAQVASWKGEENARAELIRRGYDGVVDMQRSGQVVAFFPEQIKSAIGNSGRFDPNSPSLTDPLTEFASTLRAGLDQMRAEMEAQGMPARAPATEPNRPGAAPDAPVTEPGTDAPTTRAATPTAEAAPPAGTGAAAAAAEDSAPPVPRPAAPKAPPEAPAIAAARAAYDSAQGVPLEQWLAQNPQPPEVQNLVIGLAEAGSPAKGKALLDDYARTTAAQPGRQAVDVAADVVEAARGGKQVTPEQAPANDGMARLAHIRIEYPDLQVMVDGMDGPMQLDEFMAAVKAEADEMAADAPLFKVAAECAILNGV